MSRSLPLFAVAWIASVACAHAPRAEVRAEAGIDRARGLLASRVPSEIAWGAFRAGEGGWRELSPDVTAALTRAIELDESKERVFVLRAVLDAVIELGARPRPVDLAWVREHMASLSNAVLILAAREPVANVALLEDLDRGRTDELWIAAVNLLAEHAPSRVAPRLVANTRISIGLEVVDAGSSLRGGGRHSSGIGCGSLSAPPGFPPTAVHTLRRRPHDAPDVFAPGPIAIGFEREVHCEPTFGIGRFTTPLERGDYELRLLRWIAGDRGDPAPLASEVALRHEWRGADAFVAGVVAEIDARRSAWTRLLESLRERGAIDEHVAATALPFSLTIDDRRADKSIALPHVPR